MSNIDLRLKAAELAVGSGAKDVVKTATDILAFLTAGNASAPTSKPEPATEKPAKASAQSTDKPASKPASEIPAAEEPSSEAASGFTADGAEISLDDVRSAAVKFVSANDEQALFAALKAFDADKMSSLAPANYAAFLEKISLPTASVFE